MPHTPTGILNPSATIGANVRAELSRKGKTQSDLAAHLGVSQTGVSFRLRGETEIGVNELVRIARYLEVDLAVLLVGADLEAAS